MSAPLHSLSHFGPLIVLFELANQSLSPNLFVLRSGLLPAPPLLLRLLPSLLRRSSDPQEEKKKRQTN